MIKTTLCTLVLLMIGRDALAAPVQVHSIGLPDCERRITLEAERVLSRVSEYSLGGFYRETWVLRAGGAASTELLWSDERAWNDVSVTVGPVSGFLHLLPSGKVLIVRTWIEGDNYFGLTVCADLHEVAVDRAIGGGAPRLSAFRRYVGRRAVARMEALVSDEGVLLVVKDFEANRLFRFDLRKGAWEEGRTVFAATPAVIDSPFIVPSEPVPE